MVDNCLIDPEILAELQKIKSVNFKTQQECGFSGSTKDHVLVEATSTERRLLLTCNYRDIHEGKYPPCTHGGILLIRHERPGPWDVYNRMKAFVESGQRSYARNHVTHLRENDATILKEHGQRVDVAY